MLSQVLPISDQMPASKGVKPGREIRLHTVKSGTIRVILAASGPTSRAR